MKSGRGHRLATLQGGWGILGAVLLFALLLSLLYPEAVFEGKVFVTPDSLAPAGFADYVAQRDVDSALWNPFIFAGMPAYASLSYNPGLYPVNSGLRFAIDHLGLPPLSWLLIHYLWAGLGLFLFLRGRNVRGWLAWIAAAAFLILPAQVAIGAHGHGSKVMTLAWIPWVFLFVDRLIGGRRPILDCALLAGSVAGLLLCAHVQVVYYGLLAAGLFALARLLLLGRRRGWGGAGSRLGLGILAVILAAGIAAVLYAPVQEYSHHSIRGASQGGGADYRYATLWSLHPAEWSTFLMPSSWGFGETSYFGRMPMTNYPNYVGFLAFLAALALFFAGPRRLFDVFFAGLAVFATLVAAGSTFPLLYKPLYELLPWFNRFRVPVMILLLQQMALLILFARGAERALRDERILARFRILLAAGVLVLLLAALIGPSLVADAAQKELTSKLGSQLSRWPPAQAKALVNGLASQAGEFLRRDSIVTGALLLILLGLLEANRRRLMPVPQAWIIGAIALAVLVDLWPLDRRVLHPENHWEAHAQSRLWGALQSPAEQLPPRTLGFLEEKLGAERFWALPGSRFAGNEASARGLASLTGYHAAKLALADSMSKAVPRGGAALLNRFAVRYLLSANPLREDARFPLVEQAEEFVYENLEARPRLSLADRWRVEPAAQSRQRLLTGQAQQGIVYLDGDPGIASSPAPGDPGEIHSVRWGLDEVGCELRLERPAILVLSDMNYPGWNLTVDGRSQPLLTADGFFRAAALTAGEHELSFRFEPAGIRALSLLRRVCFAVLVLLLVLGLWLGRRGAPARREVAA